MFGLLRVEGSRWVEELKEGGVLLMWYCVNLFVGWVIWMDRGSDDKFKG